MALAHLSTFCLFLLLSWSGGCSASKGVAPLPADVPVVRVRLLGDQERVFLKLQQPAVVQTTSKPTPRAISVSPDVPVPVTLTAFGWRVGDTEVGSGQLVLWPGGEGTLAINDKAYRGRYRLVPVSTDRFDVINDVDIDSYLKSVVSRELLPRWDDQAYRAQAIVARTYALYEAKTVPGQRHWDLHPDTRSQVYGGIGSESQKSRDAVDATRGVVVAYGPEGDERIFKAYFSACCGGVAQSAIEVFGDQDIPPLRARDAGQTCSISTRYNWDPVTLTKAELTRRIRQYAANRGRAEQSMGELDRIDILSTNEFGRPSRYVLTDKQGRRYSMKSEELRWAINTDAHKGTTVYSSFFKPVSQGDSITLTEGHGYGHGVGMCQWCAQALALKGTPHEEIVLWSYPGSRLVRAY